jgi:hypothetical protein
VSISTAASAVALVVAHTHDDADFEINDDQIADEERRQRTDELRGEALLRKDHAIQVQSEEIIARMMGQRCFRLD